LTVKPRLSKELGTRHRAAIGVTEETDAVAIIVSEETGSIAFAHDGEIERFLDPDTLRLRIRDAFERKAASGPPQVIAPRAEQRLDS
jgi:diadenylate cyclase